MSLPKFLNLLRSQLVAVGLVGLITGAIIILAIRFFTYSVESVHYHANFAVYINGQRELFKGPIYYEEKSPLACTESEGEEIAPGERAHMHDDVNDVVHVEDHAVTWGQFFQNLGWTVNPRLVQTRTQILPADKQHKVRFLLNGKIVEDVTSRVIDDRDRLLIDYGGAPVAVLNKEFKSVPATAEKYDTEQDPASCSGHKQIRMGDRFQHLF